MNLGQNTWPELIFLKQCFSPGRPLDITLLSGEEKENEEERRGGGREEKEGKGEEEKEVRRQ